MDFKRLVGRIGTPNAAGGLTISHWFMSLGHHRTSRAAAFELRDISFAPCRFQKEPDDTGGDHRGSLLRVLVDPVVV